METEAYYGKEAKEETLDQLHCMYCGGKMPTKAKTKGFTIVCPHCEAML